MRPHPRIRKTIKYGGAALTVLLVVVWIQTSRSPCEYGGVGPFHIGCAAEKGSITAWYVAESQGLPDGLQVGPFGGDYSTAWYRHDTSYGFAGSSFSGANPGYWSRIEQHTVALWLPTILMLTVTCIAFRLDTLARRRARLNLCPNCHYDRTGLAGDAVCPECGAASLTPPAPQSPRVS